MSEEKTVLVDVETWAGNAPDLVKIGHQADIGAVAEALVYYDKVLLNIDHRKHMHAVLDWFHQTVGTDVFVKLLLSGEVKLYHYAFSSPPIYDPRMDTYVLINVQEEGDPRSLYMTRVLGSVDKYFNTRRTRHKFLDAVESSLVIAKADEFGAAIENARAMTSEGDNMQSLIDSLFSALLEAGVSNIPVNVKVTKNRLSDEKTRFNFDTDLDALGKSMGEEYNFGRHTPLAIMSVANRFLWSAAKASSDISVSEPMYGFISDRLDNAIAKCQSGAGNLRELSQSIDFPNVRWEVQRGNLSAHDILNLRDSSYDFRRWFHSTTEYGRDIVASYNHDVINKYNLSPMSKKLIKIVTRIVPSVAGGLAGGVIGGLGGGVASIFADELVGRIIDGWTPKLFGAKLRSAVD